jgi:hypothetical protein
MTVYPHRIRLRGPWECEPIAAATGDTPLPPALRMTVPCRLAEGGLAGFAGRVRFRRRFGYPGRIDSYERVWLTFGGVGAAAEVWLNGERLGRHEEAEGPFEHEVTPLLRPRNELVVEVEAPDDRGGLWGEVALEVRRTAFLRKLRAWLTAAAEGQRLQVAGEVVGTSERPLELYALLGGRTVLYASVSAAPQGKPFYQASGPLGLSGTVRDPIRVDLVDGPVIWYAAAVPLALPDAPSETP